MFHGTEAFFEELKHNRRRVAALSVAVGLLLLSPLIALRVTPLGRNLRTTRIMRFGLAGPPRYVELVMVDARPTNLTELVDVGHVVLHSGKRGSPGPVSRHPVPGESRKIQPDPGQQGRLGEDLMSRAIASRGQVPMFQSSDLIIEDLVRPVYPEEAREHGIEGHVGVLALVDTLGQVIEAEVTQPSGDRQLDLASHQAVMQCRFRPYVDDGKRMQVYAMFRFSFRIY